jgi:CRISPR-associated protein Cas2
MRYVIAYDVASDRTRLKIAELLGRSGVRVQKSVFECALEPEELPSLVLRLERELEASSGSGNVRIYRLCADCLEESLGVGEELAEGMGGDPWLVI